MLKVKRVYQVRENNDGIRILVDRLWPRGLSPAKADIAQWLKELAPSNELRRWFAHQPERWPEFRQKYMDELSTLQQLDSLNRIMGMAASGDVTLVYAAKDGEHNNAIVLAEFVASLMTALSQTGNRKGPNVQVIPEANR